MTENPTALDPELLDAAVRARESRIALARTDPFEFNTLVLRDIETGEEIDPAPMHEEWHDLVTEHDRVIFRTSPETGKTQGISIGRVLWEIGKNPNIRVAVVSITVTKAEEIVSAIARHIESNDDLHAIFPNLVPTTEEKEPWQSDALVVKRRLGGRDATVKALGIGSKIVGGRYDLVIIDDVLDDANTHTKYQREKTFRWLNRELGARFSKTARVVMMVNAYHRDDASHRYQKMGWLTRVYPAWDEETGKLAWPSKWTLERILRKKQGPPIDYAREVLCIPPEDADSRFHPAWIQACLARGIGRRLAPYFTAPDEYTICAGVDIGVSENSKSDLSAIVVIIAYPNGDCQPLCVEAGRWSGLEIIRRILDVWSRFHPFIYVENNAAQDFIRQFAIELSQEDKTFADDPPVILAHTTTGRNKRSPLYGIESLAVELQKAKWIFPSKVDEHDPKKRMIGSDDELEELLEEIRTYSPGRHTGDRLMAMWIAREARRLHHGVDTGDSLGANLVGPSSDSDEEEFD